MADLKSVFSKSGQLVESGVVVKFLGNNSYLVSFDGVERKAINTLNEDLHIGLRVIVNRLPNNSRYIISKTTFSGNYIQQQEIFRDG